MVMNFRQLMSLLIGAVALAAIAGLTMPSAVESGTAVRQEGGPTQAAIRDAWLDGQLETALLFNEHLDSFDISAEVENGVAWLHGVVESDTDRDLAEEVARSVDGITLIENQLEVRNDPKS